MASFENSTIASSRKLSSQHKVFINFQEDALSHQFVGHLVADLKSHLCIDVGERCGDLAETFQRIKESKIALVIFSSMYTTSSWCLNELVEITQRVEEGKIVAIPILYKLDASVVKGLEEDFGLNLWNHVKRTSEFEKLKQWKEALDFISQKLTFVLNENSDEAEFISSIVKEVKRQLIRIIPTDQIPDQLSEQQKYVFTDACFSSSEELKTVDSETDIGILWDAKSNENPKEGEFYGKSRKDDNLLDEANSDASRNLQNIVESKRVESVEEEKKYEHGAESSDMATNNKNVPQYQVFINFRGEDVRFNFVSHLVSALLKKGINVFIEKDERRDEAHIGELFEKIEDSKIALVVFSSRYSESTWCLDELVKIKECMDQGKLKVIPIFYKVEPSQVQQLNGDFGSKLWNLWRLHRDCHIIKWKEALESVASLEAMMRLCLEENGSESVFVTSIVKEVNKFLTKISLQEGQNPSCCQRGRGEKPESFPNKNKIHRSVREEKLFGIEKRMEQLEKKLEFDCNETRIIGVVGMPGIGKTTLAMMLHQKWNCKFVRCVPLLGIRKKSKDYGTVWLRTTLLKVLLGGEIPVINDETTHDSVKNELLHTKVLVVLDDVSDKKQFEFLLGDLKWIKRGSKIVITTCDKSLLEGLAHDTYLVPQMDNKEAFQLFSYHALDDQICCPPEALLTRSRISVDNAGGNPLALKLMGNEICGQHKSYSEHKMQTATQSSNTTILDDWRLYINQLNERQKDVFLDILCFFKSEDEYFVRSILDSGDPDSTDAVSEVTDLLDKFLITISDSRVEMNDLVYTSGKHLGSPGRHKLSKYKNIINKLQKLKRFDTNNARGIFLDMSNLSKNILLERLTFANMHNLRYLKIFESFGPQQCKTDCKLKFSYGINFSFKEVRYLHWEKFPLEKLPSDFEPENLVDLRLPYTKIARVWEGLKETPRLKWVDLSHSSKLLDIFALSKAKNLQRLNLEGCTSLDELPVEIQNMKSLVFMNLRGCVRLWSLPKMILTSLKILILSNCSRLTKFQLTSESLEFLHLDGTSIKKFPPTIKNCRRLVLLNMRNCKLLEFIPNSLCKLKDLEELILSGCSSLKNIQDVKHSMKHLQNLRLDGTGAKEMPSILSFPRSESQSKRPLDVNRVSLLNRLSLSGNDFTSLKIDISKLHNLKWLDVKQCKKLRSIPLLPPSLQYFDAHGCDSLETVANPLALRVVTQEIHATFNFTNCYKLDQDAKNSIISYTREKSQLVLNALSRYNGGFVSDVLISTCFPGWKVPPWFSHQAFGSVLKPKLPPHWCDNKFTGIALCAVINGNHERRNHLLVKCNCEFKNEDGSRIRFSFTIGGWSQLGNTPHKIESQHVFVGYISKIDINKHGVGKNEEGCICTEASLQFEVTDGTKEVVGYKVLKCGFSLVYASAETTSIIPNTVEKSKVPFFEVELRRIEQLKKVLYSTPGKTCIIGVVGEAGIGKTTLDGIGTCFSGWEVPEWFSYRTSGSVLKQTLPSHWCNKRFIGIALCAVILFAGNHDQRNHLLLKCNCDFKNKDGSHTRMSFTVGGWSESGNTLQKIESSHVFIGYISRMDINKHGVGNNEDGCFCTEASLEFQVTDGTQEVVGCEVLKCGFSLVYASDEKTTVIPKRVEKPEMLSCVGVELRIKQLEKVLYSTPGKTRIIGVVGEPGIGKTTLAEILFKKRGSKFPINLFLRISKEHSLEQLRRTFLEELLKPINQTISMETTHHEYVKGKLLQAKSFIVLDDVSDRKQLEFLIGNLNWIKKGSKIIITTRDMSLLEGFAHETYVVPELNKREAFQLFSHYAFEDQICSPTRTFLTLSRVFMEHIGGNPLALKLLATELREENEAYWEHKMKTMKQSSSTKFNDMSLDIDKLKSMVKEETNNEIGISIDMSEVTKRIALKRSTFTNMCNLQYLNIYDSCCARQCKADCKLYFPDGLKFTLEEVRYLYWEKFPLGELPSEFRPENLVCLKLPYSKISRVWEGIKDTLRLKWIDLSYSNKLLNISALSKAENLLSLNLEGCLILDELPLEIENMKSLVFLNLRGCIRLWSFPKIELISLKTLILTDCLRLKEFQLTSKSLEFLHLDGTSIQELPPTIKDDLRRLVVLNMRNCKMLEFLPSSLCELEYLEELILSDCSSLKNLPEVKHCMKHLKILLFDGTGANEMPKVLCFSRLEGQASTDMLLQPSRLPRDVSGVSLLQRLCLSGNDFVCLQSDIGLLYHLKWLDVKHCKRLKSIPMLPPRLKYFDAHGCDSLERVANPLALPVVTEHNHATFNFTNCNKLDQEAKDNIISYTRRKSQLVLDSLSRYNGDIASEALIGTCFPGWEVPTWFSHRASGSKLEPKLPPHWFDNRFIGIALCAVIQFPSYIDQSELSVKCSWEFKNEDGIRISFSCMIGGSRDSIESSHVFIGYIRRLDVNKQEKGCAVNETSLQFQVTDGMGEVVIGCEVIKCGFILVYAPDERENIYCEEPKLIGKSLSDNDIQYLLYRKLKNDDNVQYQSCRILNPKRVKNVLGEVTSFGECPRNNYIKHQPYSSRIPRR